MGEFVGSETMIRLQKALKARGALFARAPLLSNGGRIMNILDPARYGWDNVRRAAEDDGIVGLTCVDRDSTLAALTQMLGPEVDLPVWEAFTGTPGDVLPACEDHCARAALPDGWRVESLRQPDAATIDAVQALNMETGVAPMPGYYMRGEAVPGMLTCVWDETGALAASASGTTRYHAESPMARWLFAGNVSVKTAHRRKGLGSYVNARLLVDSHAALDWVCALEQAKADNPASVGMITRCGLRQLPDKVTIVVNMTGGYVSR